MTYKIEKINGHEHAQVRVYKYEDGTVVLHSYATDVCMIDKDGWLTVNGLYSRTTIKHIGWFMSIYGKGFGYYTAKRAYETGMVFNLETGEVLTYEEYNKLVEKIA